MTVRTRVAAAAALAAMTALPLALSAQQISNVGSLSEGSFVEPFGNQLGGANGQTGTYGQTFTAPAGALNNFSFWLRDDDNGGALLFHAFIAEWNGSAVVGSPIWQSGLFSGTDLTTFQQYTFTPGGLSLTPGDTYLAFINSSDFDAANPTLTSYMDAAVENSGTSLPGDFEYNNGATLGDLDAPDQWNNGGFPFGADMIFEANFGAGGNVTPEPTTMALLGTGLVALVGVGRRRRNRSTV